MVLFCPRLFDDRIFYSRTAHQKRAYRIRKFLEEYRKCNNANERVKVRRKWSNALFEVKEYEEDGCGWDSQVRKDRR